MLATSFITDQSQISPLFPAKTTPERQQSDAPTHATLKQISQIRSPLIKSDATTVHYPLLTAEAIVEVVPDDSSAASTPTGTSAEMTTATSTDVTEPAKPDTPGAGSLPSEETASVAKNIHSIQTKRAISIQTVFRHYKARIDENSLVSFSSRCIMMGHMRRLNQLVHQSITASNLNGETFDVEAVARNLDESDLERYEELAGYFDAAWQSSSKAESINSQLIIDCLRLLLKAEQMACNALALTQAILLRSDARLPKTLRDQVCVCTVGGHMMCCIGDPKKKDSMILDPWTRYLTLPPHEKWRPSEVLWAQSGRERGFMGSVAQYLQFLADHPNPFVPEPMPIIEHDLFTSLSQSITAADIGLAPDISSSTASATSTASSGSCSPTITKATPELYAEKQ